MKLYAKTGDKDCFAVAEGKKHWKQYKEGTEAGFRLEFICQESAPDVRDPEGPFALLLSFCEDGFEPKSLLSQAQREEVLAEQGKQLK